MKCQNAEKLILLQDCGEIKAPHRDALSAHLRKCAECRNFQRALAESQEALLPRAEPSATAVQNVLREARLNAPEKKTFALFSWKPMLALAASIAVVLGLLTVPNGNKVGMELVVTEQQMLESEDQIVSVMYEGLSEDDLAFNFLMTYEDSYASL